VESGYPHPHGGGGGAGTYVQVVGRELVRKGHQVSVIASWCSICQKESSDNGVIVYRPRLKGYLHWYAGKIPGIRVGSLSLGYLEYGLQIHRFIQNLHKINPINLIEYSEGGDFWHMFKPKFPYIIHLHGSRYSFLKASGRNVGKADWWHRKLELCFISKANHIMSPSKALLKIVEEERGKGFSNSTILPYPLDPELEDYKPVQVENRNGKKVIFAARNDPVKGGQILLQAIPFIRNKVPDTKFEFFGFKPDHNNQTIDNSICFNEFLPKAELLKRYKEADLCIIPSFWDNSPNTVYEAMAAGKAIVASRVGGIPELIEDGVTGILVKPGNDQELADAIIELLLNNEKRHSMGERGRERILGLARLKDNIEKRLTLYQQVIEIFHSNQLSKKMA
jgi:glycosyltransferase involved in cell wall biosynthesis